MKKETIRKMADIVGSDHVIAGEDIEPYLFDEVQVSQRLEPDRNSIVVKPRTPEEISEIMKYANESKTVVVVRGGGTGLSAACVPTRESIIISMERFTDIIEIDKKNMVATVEAGVTLAAFLEELEKHKNVCFPVHPGDEGAQAGGMAVTNAGGARAVRHGVMRRQIMGLEVVTPTGAILNLGGKMIKNNAGYNLKEIIIGSEGTLAVVTKVMIKIYPLDNYSATIVAPFETFEDAAKTVTDLLESGNVPLAVEYQEKWLFVEAAKLLGKEWPAHEGNADLLIILSEKTEDALYRTLRELDRICKANNSYEMYYASRKEEQAELLDIRNNHYELIKNISGYSFDMAVPVGSVPDFLKELKGLVAEYGTETHVTAHIADGNIHHGIMKVNGSLPPYTEELKRRMLEACFRYGGTITGEHGVGKKRIAELKMQKSPAEIEIMRGIKRAFDPNMILNPGTVID